MRTITYYSYKGGVGRTLLVANTAKYLSTLGKSVFALDLDLEAPGLHYKFELGKDARPCTAMPGMVDILVNFIDNQTLPASLSDYVSNVDVTEGAGTISIMRSGSAPSGGYWKLLSKVNWYELFYGEAPSGVPFFLELKERIRNEFNPDFFLIDARTGITEMGGIATTLLPDSVVCLTLTSAEHLEGVRAVMHGIRQTSITSNTSVKLLPVVSRMSQKRNEEAELASIQEYLNAPLTDDSKGLDIDDLMILHAEPLLDSGEQVLVGSKNSPHELPLLRDYLRLFSRIIPAEDIQPHVGSLIQRAVSRLLDDPDTAQSELEALTTYCADQDAFRALLKLYQVRGAPIEKIVPTASLMWQLTTSRTEPDRLLTNIVKSAFSEQKPGDFQKRYADFAEEIWRANGLVDIKVGLTLVKASLPERPDKAIQILSDYVDKILPPYEGAVIRLLELLRVYAPFEDSIQLIDRFKTTIKTPEFYAAWAQLILDKGDPKQVAGLLANSSFNEDSIRHADPIVLYKMYKITENDKAEPLLEQALENAISNEEIGRLRELGEVFSNGGRLGAFEERLSKRLPPRLVEDILEFARAHGRRMPRRRYIAPG